MQLKRKYKRRNGAVFEKNFQLFDNFTHSLSEAERDSLASIFERAVRKAFTEKDKFIAFFVENGRDYSQLRASDRLYPTKVAFTEEELEMFRELVEANKGIIGDRNESETARRVLYYYYATKSE
jgi:hypothetical protein